MFNSNVRKSVLALILLALVMPMGRAFAQSGQSTTKPLASAPVVGGTDPEPQVVGGTDPEPQINTMQMILILLHMA
ncbi:hypothetical protein [Granulicella mallensis]|uniref:Uncharacterized protein n=1 Tax=Granulicella mallensis TaxID=940614 RepID=A0A7W7ZLS9_9BACT|nr:hypothetical protein [Granulicella mallensis]MBB5062290.1 hypothetical protein [Granulicella mallensis]